MKLSGSASVFSAAIAGQVVGSMLSPESYIGWQVKGATWLVRGLKAALQQAGIAGVADLATQKNLVEAGVQDEIDLSRAGGAAAAGFVSGAVTSIASKGGTGPRESLGITPEGFPKQQDVAPEVTVDAPAPVATRPDAPDVVPPDLPGPPMAKDEPAAPGVPSSEAQAVVPQEMPATSQVPTPQGAARQEQPLGVRGKEPAPVSPATEPQASGGKTLAANASVPQSTPAVAAPNTPAQQPTGGHQVTPGSEGHLPGQDARLGNHDGLYKAAIQKMNAEYTHAGVR